MTKRYILTGAPGSGKTSILRELEKRGEYTLPEAAESIIREQQSMGIEKPWLLDDFQTRILELQIKGESNLINPYTEHLRKERVFIDRGVLDGKAYVKPNTNEEYEINLRTRSHTIIMPYDGVFLIENLGKIERTIIRKESFEEALILERKFEEIYINSGYKVNRIPPISIESRADEILRIIQGGVRLR